MKSKLESLNDTSLSRYLNYVKNALSNVVDIETIEFTEFYEKLTYDLDLERKIFSPIRGGDRYDVEYIFECFLLNNFGNNNFDPNDLMRPNQKGFTVDYMADERELTRRTYRIKMETYLTRRNFDTSYLWQLKNEDEIDPWSWEHVDTDYLDSDFVDDDFDIH